MACVEMRGITKRFGAVLANDAVSITVDRGEILSLLGENGSGKSTLVNILAGLYAPDAGTLSIDGRECRFRSPRDAIAAGVGMVHQHFMLVPVLRAWENICLGERAKSPFLQKKAICRKIDGIAKKFGIAINLEKKIYDMSVGEKQTVEIVKMLYRGAQTLILDEPTAVLTPQETETLFAMLRFMRGAGCAIIIITHKLAEVLAISDRITVLRRGRTAGTVRAAEATARSLSAMMVGESISLEIDRPPPRPSEAPMLRVRGLSVTSREGTPLLRSLSFDLSGGELLGVAGLAGNGQKELCEAIAGLQKRFSGSVTFLGEELAGLSPRAIRRRGVCLSFIPEDRLGMGLVGGMSVTDNVLLRGYDLSAGPLVDRARAREAAERIVKKYDIATPTVNHMVRKLSGGNIQKVLLGRELETRPRLLITAYPVRGLDVGASYAIYHLINAQKAAGVAVLFIGEDLDVLLALSDRLLILCEGAAMGIVDPRAVTKEDVGLMMLGRKEAACG
jgi:simple sugar transport system ATP-binding protein